VGQALGRATSGRTSADARCTACGLDASPATARPPRLRGDSPRAATPSSSWGPDPASLRGSVTHLSTVIHNRGWAEKKWIDEVLGIAYPPALSYGWVLRGRRCGWQTAPDADLSGGPEEDVRRGRDDRLCPDLPENCSNPRPRRMRTACGPPGAVADPGRSRRVDVRVIASTMRDVGPGGRDDLWHELHGLNAAEISIPPLRQRTDEIPVFASFFLEQFNRRYRRDVQLRSDVLATFRARPWP